MEKDCRWSQKSAKLLWFCHDTLKILVEVYYVILLGILYNSTTVVITTNNNIKMMHNKHFPPCNQETYCKFNKSYVQVQWGNYPCYL